MSKKAETKLSKAKVQLLLHRPFFAQVLMETRLYLTDKVPTMATDGPTIMANTQFVEEHSVDELIAVLVHECMHIIGMHHLRIQGRDHAKFNAAADYAINPLIKDEGLSLPDSALLKSEFRNMSAEEIYNRIPNDEAPQCPQDVYPIGSFSDGQPGDGDGDGQVASSERYDAAAEEERVKRIVNTAAAAAKMQGKLPGHLEEFVDEMNQTATPWQDLLRKYMIRESRDDYSWSQPNRRHIAGGLYLPALHGNNGMGPVVVGVDTSGSIGNDELNAFLAELRTIVEDAQPSSVEVVYFDTDVERVDSYEEPSATDIQAFERTHGGTDFRSVFNWVEREGIEPDTIVMMTDLYGPFPDEETFDTVWVCPPDSSGKTPFGERIDIGV